MTCEFFSDSFQDWLFIKFMSFLSSKEKLNGWRRCWGEEGIYFGEQISQFSYLTFLKWFCNSEQERIINRNGYLFFGAFPVLNFPIIQEELGLRDQRTGTEGNLTWN